MRKLIVILSALIVVAAGCNFNVPEATPTVEGIVEEPINPIPDREITEAPTLTPSASPSATLSRIVLESPTPTGTAAPPTLTYTPTETPGPYEHRVQSGETLITIALQFGYRELNIIDEIVTLNGLGSAADIQVGQLIRIPRQTPTPTPVGYEQTAVINATLGVTPLQSFSADAEIGCHTVEEGESMITIAIDYNTTIEVLRDLNPQIVFPNTCDYNLPSGGPGCNVLINVGQCVNVPFPTPTPTLSPTPSGSETPTATPTYAPPQLISPPTNGIVRGIVTLTWVPVRLLKPDEVYVVEVVDLTTGGAPFTASTRDNSYTLPEELIPSDGQTHTFEWRVFVAVPNELGVFRRVTSGAARQFQWLSR